MIVLLVNILPVAGEFLQTEQTFETSDLPIYFNWRDMDGIDFTTSIKNQGLSSSKISTSTAAN